MHGVLPLAVVHAALYLALRARPGAIAVTLWTWGPPLLVACAIVLLGGAFVSARRPRQVWTVRRLGAFAGLVMLVASVGVYRAFPSEHDFSPSGVLMRLPLDGAITVAWGGATPRVNYHVRSPAERWAFDLLVTVEGRTYAGSGHAVTDYHAYNLPVRAPADGQVVSVHDGEPDAVPGRPEPSRRGGNRIVIEVARGQYMFLMHLKEKSILVQPGQHVRRGQILARVGNSGNSTEPHLHLHLADAHTGPAQGIPFYFQHYVDLKTGERVERGMPQGGVTRGRYVGDIVQQVSESQPGS